MKTIFTRFRYVLATVICCLVSIGSWGQDVPTKWSVQFSDYTAGIQYAHDEEHKIDDYLTIYTTECHFTNELRVYDSSTHDGFFYSNALPGKITTMGFNAGNKKGTVEIYGNNNGDDWKLVDKFTTTSAYKDYSITFDNAEYNFFKIEVTGGAQIRFKSLSIEISISPSTAVSTPTFNPESGTTFTESQNVTLNCATEDATIYYTINGDDPTTSSTPYDAAGINITETTTIKAIAVKSGLDNSGIAEATYTKVKPTPTITFEQESYNLNVDGTATIVATTNSSAAIVYSSDNENVATVNPATGEVSALAAGTATITASVAETDTYTAAETSYKLTVIKVIDRPVITVVGFKETFDECDGDGGNDDQWSSVNPPSTKIEGWIGSLYNANKCIKLGTGSANGSATTPALNIEGNAILTFKAGAWNATDDGTILNLSITGNGLLEQQSVEMVKGAFTNYTITINDLTKDSKITFTAESQRFFLDDVVVSKEITAAEMSTNSVITLAGTWTADDFEALSIPENVTSIDMTGITIPADAPSLTIANPNCLIYVAVGTTYPDTWKNVVEGTDAPVINLQDGYDFNNTKAFDATEINYTRTFAKGWNTLALPFGTAVAEGDDIEEYSEKTETSIKFTTATSINANEAYLIKIDTDETEKKFTGSGDVPVAASTGEVFKSNFKKLTGADAFDKYILVLEEGKEVFAPASENATVAAFRGYLDLAQAPKYAIVHGGDGTTNIDRTSADNGLKVYSDNGVLIINANEVQNVQIYALDGRMVKTIQLAEGDNTVTGLAKGVYLINNQKAIVK